MSKPLPKENQEIGAQFAHMLIGSPEWLAVKEREADRDKKHFSLHGAMKSALVRAYESDEPDGVRMAYGRDEGETDTGKQVHHTFVNHTEMRHALELLELRHPMWHRRYVAFEFEGRSAAEIATAEGVDAETIERYLRYARSFLVAQVCT